MPRPLCQALIIGKRARKLNKETNYFANKFNVPNDCSIEDLENLSESKQPKSPRSHVTSDAEFTFKFIYHTASQ